MNKDFNDVITRRKMHTYSQISPSGGTYIIPGMIKLGAINIIQGFPGCGKTSVVASIAAAVSGKRQIPGIPINIHGPVIMVTTEDNEGELRMALDAGEANTDLCHDVGDQEDLTIASDDIEAMIVATGAVMIVFDPLQAYLSGYSMNQADLLRPALSKLAAVVRRNHCAAVFITHTSKNALDKSPIAQSLGSIDIPAAARCISSVITDPKDPQLHCIVPVKSSGSPLAPVIDFRIGADRSIIWGTVRGEIDPALEQDPVYCTFSHLADATSETTFSYRELESVSLSLTSRSLGGWDLMSLKLRSAVGALLASQGITVTLQGDNENDGLACLRTPYVIPGVLEDSHE